MISTEEPTGRWNHAALGLHGSPDHEPHESVRARTWGNTRTKRNLVRTSHGYVQVFDDSVAYVEAALGLREHDDPIDPCAAAWTEVTAHPRDEGSTDGTRWTDWELSPERSYVRRQAIPQTCRGTAAVIEYTVAASRIGVAGYATEALEDRLTYFANVIRRCGTPRDQAALERANELIQE